jgi:polyhydroxyalkanoate synthesis regulator phasin
VDRKTRLIAGTVAGLAVTGGGAAIAASHFSGANDSQTVVNDAAKQLGVQPSALTAALKKGLEDRVDAAVAAGRLTKAEGDALKQRIESGELPLFGAPHGPGGFHGGGFFGGLGTAASYLGLTEVQLRSDLESGKTPAQVAQAQGKSVDGLVQALYDQAKQKLDTAVSAGRLTQTQEGSILSELKSQLTGFVNGTRPAFGRDRGPVGPPPTGPFGGPGV